MGDGMKVDERIAKNAITPDDEPHIVIDQESCKTCDPRPCLRVDIRISYGNR